MMIATTIYLVFIICWFLLWTESFDSYNYHLKWVLLSQFTEDELRLSCWVKLYNFAQLRGQYLDFDVGKPGSGACSLMTTIQSFI